MYWQESLRKTKSRKNGIIETVFQANWLRVMTLWIKNPENNEVVPVDCTWSREVPCKWNTHALRITPVHLHHLWRNVKGHEGFFFSCVFLKASYRLDVIQHINTTILKHKWHVPHANNIAKKKLVLLKSKIYLCIKYIMNQTPTLPFFIRISKRNWGLSCVSDLTKKTPSFRASTEFRSKQRKVGCHSCLHQLEYQTAKASLEYFLLNTTN